MYPILVAILKAGRAYGFTDPYILPENPVGPLPEITLRLSNPIIGADAAKSNGVPMRDAFQNLVATARDITPTCMSPIPCTCNTFGLTRGFSWCSMVPLVTDTLSFHFLVYSLT